MAKKIQKNQFYPEIQRLLEKQRTAFFTEVRERMKGSIPSSQECESKPLDQVHPSQLLDHEQRYLRRIEEALKRLEEEKLEICESCQGEIDYRRLKARPITTLCIECQKRLEEAEKQVPPLDDLNREGILAGSFLGRGSCKK